MRVGRPGSKSLKEILMEIDRGTIKIPEFQRDFRWEINDIIDLVVSIMRGFPVGILLLWDVRECKEEKLSTRVVEGVKPQYISTKTNYLILDGQQRLTSLYQLFYCDYVTLSGGRKRKFFINLEKLKEQDFENCIEYFSEKEVRRNNLDDIKVQVYRHLLPFNILISEDKLREWKSKYVMLQLKLEKENEDPTTIYRLTQMINEFDEKFLDEGKPLKNLLEYYFHCVELPPDLSLEAVVTIFEKLNTTGQPLNIFEILTAKFYNTINLRKIWEETKDKYPMIKKFTKDEKDTSLAILIMKSILLKKSIDDPGFDTLECKRKNLLEDLEPPDIQKYWDGMAFSLEKSLNIISNDYGSPSIDFLPYSTMLTPMSVIVDYIENKLDITQKGSAYNKLRSWYWTSVLSGRYDSATDTKSKQDVKDVIKWIKDGTTPDLVKNFDAKNINFEEITKGAIYKGILSISIMEGCVDLLTGEPIKTLINTNPTTVDIHHVFPYKFLKDRYGEKSEQYKKVDTILNKIVIRSETNQKYISHNPPTVYLKNIQKNNPKINVNNAIKSHLLPISLLENDDFDSFLNERKEILTQKIRELIKP